MLSSELPVVAVVVFSPSATPPRPSNTMRIEKIGTILRHRRDARNVSLSRSRLLYG